MPHPPAIFLLIILLAIQAGPSSAANEKGSAIYREQCASCHGAQGEGHPKHHPEPLIGERSLDSLTKRIERTMPEDEPDTCVGDDAKAVAEFIYDAFYSPEAQARNNPERIDLARLTTTQYRNSIADLVAQFRSGSDRDWKDSRGLNVSYRSPTPITEEELKELKPNSEPRKHTVNHSDTVQLIDFQHSDRSPVPEKIDPLEFNARYEGSLLPATTGPHEIIVRSENGFRLWINSSPNATIDAWVTAGDQIREEKTTAFLIAGRAYPIVLEQFKFREKSASLQLLWKPPHGVEEIIPHRHLTPTRMKAVATVSSSFPADDRSHGYERGTSLSKEWLQATTQAAIQASEYIENNIDELAGTKPNAEDRNEKLRTFAETFAELAFRRPLDDSQKNHIAGQFKAAKTPEIAVKRSVLFALKSPRFLFPTLPHPGGHDDFDIAAHLALTLWDSIPDKRLLQAAKENRLHEKNDIRRAAERLMTDPRARAKVSDFFHHWLEFDHAENASKDPKKYPQFDAAVLADLRTSLELFVEHTVWSDSSDYRQLILADKLYLNPRLAKLYGKEVKDPDFIPVAFSPQQRAGVITHPFLLATLATPSQTSPIHRGVFLSRNIVGLPLKSPPIAVAFEESQFDPHLTMREKITELTKDSTCMSCHSTINPLGFSLENFDAIGRWRTKEGDKPIDPTATLPLDEDTQLQIKGPRDIANHVVQDPAAHRAFIRSLFQHLVKQNPSAYGLDTLDKLQQSFASNNFHIQKLIIEIAVLTATPPPPTKSQ